MDLDKSKLRIVNNFVMEPSKIAIICLYICTVLGVLTMIVAYKLQYLGILVFGLFTMLFSLLAIIYSNKDKLIVENETFIRKQLFGKQKVISFSEVKEVQFINREYPAVRFYLNNGKVICIPEYFTNCDLLRKVIREQHWRVRR